ncbi:MAG: hypothetical protein Kow00121_39850 [Elainellaceae cyanobacterium]
MKTWQQNITTKVAGSFLLLSLMTVGVVGTVAFLSAREALKQAAYNRLNVSATLKEEEITRWFEDQQRDFFLVTQFPEIQQSLDVILATKPADAAFAAAYATLSTYLTDIAAVKPNLSEVFVLNRSNQIVLSTDPSREGEYEVLASVTYLEEVKPGNTFDPIFYVSPLTGKPSVTLATSLYDEAGNRQGLILANLSLDRIDQIVREKTGLGKSGETYLVASLVNEYAFISRENSFLPDLPTIGISSLGIDRAMQGISGSGLYRNYANVPVVGVYRWLNDQDIALIVEMQQEEAFAPARQLAGIIVLVGLVSVGVLAIGVAWLTRQLQLSQAQLENYSHRLEQKAREANAANRAKSEFLANMSHELRTPLNAILGFTQLMVRDSAVSESQMEHLRVINRSGEHLLTLINDVLEMSKIEAGQTILNEHDFDLHYLLDSLEDLLQLKAQSQGLSLTFKRESNVPQYVRTDEGKLRQVLINLLGNAIKFTDRGKVELWVSAAAAIAHSSKIAESVPTPYRLRFTVKDTGPGIAPTEIKSLFEPFVQAEAGRLSKQGTGLGLPISQRFVQLMGGDIAVESKVGQGTIFTFTVQAAPGSWVERPSQQFAQPVIGLAAEQPRYRILIVEDQWENRQLLVKMLDPLGFEIREAENGQEGIAVWETWEPDLIWMDMRMPVMDGYETTKYIKAQPQGKKTVVIAITASAFEEERAAVLAVGCDDFVRKPFKEQAIFDTIAKHLGVRYRYKEQRRPSGDQSATPPSSLCAEDLAVMPLEWTSKLQQAAIQVDAEQIQQLLLDIPGSHHTLLERLSHLTQHYCFDEIVDLTQTCLDRS